MSERRFSRQDAVSKSLFIDLYQGALKIDDRTKRIIAATYVLLGGRLKMRKNELMHFHDGWLYRQYGLIRIPDREPCICKYCHHQAKENHTENDAYDSVSERFVNERYRSKNKRVRWVPYNWSPRIIAAIETYVEEVGVYPDSARSATRLLKNHILRNTEFLEPGDIDWRGVRATGDTFWAFQGLNTKKRAEIGGHREAELGTYSGTSPVEMSNILREKQGLDTLDFPKYDPVAIDARPHQMEPFEDPREIDPLENYDPFSTSPKVNPRTEERRADIDLTVDDFDTPENYGAEANPKDLEGLHKRWETRLRGEEDSKKSDPYKRAFKSRQEKSDGPKSGQSILFEFSP